MIVSIEQRRACSSGRRAHEHKRRPLQIGIGISTLALLHASPLQAQGPDYNGAASDPISDGVFGRRNSEYAPLGIKAGGFTIFPQIQTRLNYDSNIYDRQQDIADDEYISVQPRVQVRSDWSRHSLALDASGDIRRYADLSSENSDQGQAGVTGRLDVTNDAHVTATGSFARLIEPRGTAGDLFATGKPISYRQLAASLKADAAFGRWSTAIDGAVTRYRYDDTTINGVKVPLGDRNYRSLDGAARLAYALGPSIATYVSVSVNQARYPNESRTVDRQSHGYSLIGGVAFGVTDLLSGEVGLGYLHQSFKDPQYSDVGGLDYQLALNWNPTPLLSIRADAGRDIQRAPIIGSAAITSSRFELSASYELLRQLILSATARYQRDVFKGASRSDNRLTGRIGARYLIDRMFSLVVDAAHRRQRGSGGVRREYDDSRVSLGFIVQR